MKEQASRAAAIDHGSAEWQWLRESYALEDFGEPPALLVYAGSLYVAGEPPVLLGSGPPSWLQKLKWRRLPKQHVDTLETALAWAANLGRWGARPTLDRRPLRGEVDDEPPPEGYRGRWDLGIAQRRHLRARIQLSEPTALSRWTQTWRDELLRVAGDAYAARGGTVQWYVPRDAEIEEYSFWVSAAATGEAGRPSEVELFGKNWPTGLDDLDQRRISGLHMRAGIKTATGHGGTLRWGWLSATAMNPPPHRPKQRPYLTVEVADAFITSSLVSEEQVLDLVISALQTLPVARARVTSTAPSPTAPGSRSSRLPISDLRQPKRCNSRACSSESRRSPARPRTSPGCRRPPRGTPSRQTTLAPSPRSSPHVG